MSQPDEYLDFLEKFEVKRTTDDCFTPPAVYQTVLDWVMQEYGLQGRPVMRPFFPSGDYQAETYSPGSVVIDNPPFSCITQIVRWYEWKKVDYFLFAPTLTLFGIDATCALVVNEAIIYENGAVVNTSFITNLDAAKIRTAPDLKQAVREAVTGLRETRTLPNYKYPDNAITAARMNRIASIPFMVAPERVSRKLGRLESQKPEGKSMFGGGYLVSDQVAAEIKAAEIKAAEIKAAEIKAAVEVIEWGLSAGEREIIKRLNEGQPEPRTLDIFEGEL